MKGYKVFNSDWTCRGFQYEVGKTYKHEGNIGLCKAGFHFCQKINDCFNYYHFDSENKVAEVEAIGLIKTDGDKCVTDEIKIVREISWIEVLTMVNMGKNCTGLSNTGNCNTGDYNIGSYNTGNCNTGKYNTGNYNIGIRNTGNYNTGDYNIGSYNTGNCNTGKYNTGDWNKTDFSSGFFNTMTQPIYAFNKKLDISRNKFYNCDGMLVLRYHFKDRWWINSEHMTEEEKQAHPEYTTIGGYLKIVDFKTACKVMWDGLSDDNKQDIREIPNFDADIFEEITGIKV